MEQHGVLHAGYENHTSTFVSHPTHVEKVARAALKNIPGSEQLLQKTFRPQYKLDVLQRPEIRNQKLYGPYDFGR